MARYESLPWRLACAVAICLCLSFHAGCGEKKDQSEAAKPNPDKDHAQPASGQEGADGVSDEEPGDRGKICCFRLASISINENSMWRGNEEIAQPPDIYLEVFEGKEEEGHIVLKSQDIGGWDVEYPLTPSNEFDMWNTEAEYTFQVCTDNLRNIIVLKEFGPYKGADLVHKAMADGSEMSVKLFTEGGGNKDEDVGVTILLRLVGDVQYLRLDRIDIPAQAPCRKPFDENKETPNLRVQVYRGGDVVKNVAGNAWSTLVKDAWNGTYSRRDRNNYWRLVLAPEIKYDVLVQDTNYGNESVFRVSGFGGEEFSEPIEERVDEQLRDFAAKVYFQLLEDMPTLE